MKDKFILTDFLAQVYLLIFLFCFSYSALAEPSDHALMNQWLNLEKQKGQLAKDFHQREEAIKLQLQLLSIEEKALTEVVSKMENDTDEVEAERVKLIKQQNTLEQEQKLVHKQLDKFSTQLAAFTDLLPPPLQSTWKENISFIQDKANSDSERLERLLATCTTFHEFNERITLHQANIALADSEKTIRVKQVFLGAAVAWYVSNDGSYFGYGQAYEGKWKWWHQHETSKILASPLQAQDIIEVVNIIENPSSAKLTRLPLALQKLETKP